MTGIPDGPRREPEHGGEPQRLGEPEPVREPQPLGEPEPQRVGEPEPQRVGEPGLAAGRDAPIAERPRPGPGTLPSHLDRPIARLLIAWYGRDRVTVFRHAVLVEHDDLRPSARFPPRPGPPR